MAGEVVEVVIQVNRLGGAQIGRAKGQGILAGIGARRNFGISRRNILLDGGGGKK
jgi:hypothetical protein